MNMQRGDWQSMTKPLAFFVGSIALSAVMAIPFLGFHKYEEHQYVKIVEECRRGNELRSQQNHGLLRPDICDFNETLKIPREARTQVERMIVDESPRLKMDTLDVYLGSVAGVLLIGGLPMVWYFFLRRLSEVSRAIKGL
ncbi:MAG: hypothetical protein JSS57_02485 [Proteobacteria bacterium]|nr:hypothetical protein [Pseudomonadota bacterium]